MYRTICSSFFSTRQFVSLAKQCVVLVMIWCVLIALSPSLFAQITHPYANSSLVTNHKKLQKNFELVLTGVTLRNAIGQISQNCEALIWLDRRIDGEQVIDIQEVGITHEQAIEKIVDLCKLQRVWVGAVPYICSAEHRNEVEFIYWSIASQQECWLTKQNCASWSWSTPSEPRALIQQFSQANQIRLEGLEQIELDQWSSKSIPPMDAATNLALLLSGFGRTLKAIRKNEWRIEPIVEAELDATYVYETKFLQSIKADKIQAWRTDWEGKSDWKKQSNQHQLKAPFEAHRDLFVSSLNLPPPAPAPVKSDSAKLKNLERKKLTVRVQGRLVDVLPKILVPLDLVYSPDDLKGPLGESVIDIDVRELKIDQLLQAIAESAKCVVTRDKLKVTIKAK